MMICATRGGPSACEDRGHEQRARFAPIERRMSPCWLIDTSYNGESFFVRHGLLHEAAWSSLCRIVIQKTRRAGVSITIQRSVVFVRLTFQRSDGPGEPVPAIVRRPRVRLPEAELRRPTRPTRASRPCHDRPETSVWGRNANAYQLSLECRSITAGPSASSPAPIASPACRSRWPGFGPRRPGVWCRTGQTASRPAPSPTRATPFRRP